MEVNIFGFWKVSLNLLQVKQLHAGLVKNISTSTCEGQILWCKTLCEGAMLVLRPRPRKLLGCLETVFNQFPSYFPLFDLFCGQFFFPNLSKSYDMTSLIFVICLIIVQLAYLRNTKQ